MSFTLRNAAQLPSRDPLLFHFPDIRVSAHATSFASARSRARRADVSHIAPVHVAILPSSGEKKGIGSIPLNVESMKLRKE